MEFTQSQKEAIEQIKNLKGCPIVATVKQISNSGTSRIISFAAVKNNGLYRLDYAIQIILHLNATKKSTEGLIINGCGMDMIFHTLYNLNGRIAVYDGQEYSHLNCCNYFFDANNYLSL
jgi:hypothetical protein